MKLTRRDLMAASLVGGIGMPSVFQQFARAAGALDDAGSGDTILVVVQLTGGNDGLNTVIPFRLIPSTARADPPCVRIATMSCRSTKISRFILRWTASPSCSKRDS